MFPDEPALWQRSQDPYDVREGDGRWLAEPTAGGSIRCRVENDGDETGNAGFYVGIGEIGSVRSITIDSESVRSEGDVATLGAALYFDVTGDGDYFEWQRSDGSTERFVDLGGDVEGVTTVPSDEPFTIDDEVGFLHIPTMDPGDAYPVSFGDYLEGEVEDVEATTRAALQVSVAGGGADTVEEAIVRDVMVEIT